MAHRVLVAKGVVWHSPQGLSDGFGYSRPAVDLDAGINPPVRESYHRISQEDATDTAVGTTERFEEQMLPHLGAAFNLARHLTRSDHDAEDVVQEAFLRALRYFDAFRGQNARAWLLAIVRHTTYTRHRRDQLAAITTEFNDELHSESIEWQGPEGDLEHRETVARVQSALDRLPAPFREVLVLRELEDLSYEEISRIVRAPIGTVMSRLSRARARLEKALSAEGGTKS